MTRGMSDRRVAKTTHDTRRSDEQRHVLFVLKYMYHLGNDISGGCSMECLCVTVDLVIFACLDFREFVIIGFLCFWNLRIIDFDDRWHYYNNFRGILKFENLSSSRNSRKLKPREYYQICSIFD